MLDELADLLVGSACPGCGRPSARLCEDCRARLPSRAQLVPGPLPLACAGDYADPLASLLRAHKDKAALQLARPLGWLLGLSVAALDLDPDDLLLVPVPSSPTAVRERGYDHGAALARVAAHRFGGRVQVARGVLTRGALVVDQSRLGIADRAANQRGSLVARAGSGRVVVTDDICTTGASLAESIRALRGAGWTVEGAAVVARTRRLNARSRKLADQ